jgi:hypothetical protein
MNGSLLNEKFVRGCCAETSSEIPHEGRSLRTLVETNRAEPARAALATVKTHLFQRAQIAGLRTHDRPREQDVAHAMLALDPDGRGADGDIVKRESGRSAVPPVPDSYVNKTGTSSRCRMRDALSKATTC